MVYSPALSVTAFGWLLVTTGFTTIGLSEFAEATIRVWESTMTKMQFEHVWDAYISAKNSSNPTAVHVGVYINTVYNVNELNMDFTVNLLLRLHWKDKRLAAPLNQSSLPALRIMGPQMENRIWNSIWLPDITFRNEIRSFFHVVPVPNKLLIVNGDGSIRFVPKMDLHKFPMDVQRCPIYMESYGHTMEGMQLEWLEEGESVEFNQQLELSQYQLIGHKLANCTMQYQTGTYPCLQVDIILKRNIYYYLVQIYLPATLVVILSWVGFWINCSSEPARVSLSLLAVLTMSTQRASVNTSLPPVSYVKALDIWMTTSLIFVFLSLIEYAIVNVLAMGGLYRQFARTGRRRKRNRRRGCSKTTSDDPEPKENSVLDAKMTTNAMARELSLNLSVCPLAQPETVDTPRQNTSDHRELFLPHHLSGDSSGTMSKLHSRASTSPPPIQDGGCRVEGVENRLPSSPSLGSPQFTPLLPKCSDLSAPSNAKLLSTKDLALKRARFVDQLSRVLFPASFILFNIGYWFNYLHDLHFEEHDLINYNMIESKGSLNADWHGAQ